MQDQHRNVHLLQILREICLRKRLDAIISTLETAHHPLRPPALYHALADLRAVAIEAEEWTAGDIEEELRSIFQHRSPEPVEDVYGKSAGIGSRLEHKWWDGTDQDSLGHPARSMASNHPGHLTTACGMANHHGILEVEVFEELVQVV